MFKSLQEQLKNNNEQLEKTTNELEEQIRENSEQTKENNEKLTAKLDETNTRVEALENRVQQSLNEQAKKIENKFKEYKVGWTRDLKENFKQLFEHLNERLTDSKQEQGMKIKEVNERLRENVAKTQGLEAVSYTHLDVYKRQTLAC